MIGLRNRTFPGMAIKVWRAIIRPFQDPGKAVAAHWGPLNNSCRWSTTDPWAWSRITGALNWDKGRKCVIFPVFCHFFYLVCCIIAKDVFLVTWIGLHLVRQPGFIDIVIAHLSRPWSNCWVALSFLVCSVVVRLSRYGNIFSSSTSTRPGPPTHTFSESLSSPRAESARAVTGRQCSHSAQCSRCQLRVA